MRLPQKEICRRDTGVWQERYVRLAPYDSARLANTNRLVPGVLLSPGATPEIPGEPADIPECLLCHLPSRDESSYLIEQFYWELSDTAPIHECGLSLVHEIWVATEYLRDVYRRRVTVPVYVMGQAIDAHTPDNRLTRATFRLPADAYVFLFSFDAGSVVERKDPLASAEPFRKTFPRRD